jgi:hypothetical protein
VSPFDILLGWDSAWAEEMFIDIKSGPATAEWLGHAGWGETYNAVHSVALLPA